MAPLSQSEEDCGASLKTGPGARWGSREQPEGLRPVEAGAGAGETSRKEEKSAEKGAAERNHHSLSPAPTPCATLTLLGGPSVTAVVRRRRRRRGVWSEAEAGKEGFSPRVSLTVCCLCFSIANSIIKCLG